MQHYNVRKHKHKKDSGFTLVEMVVTSVVAGVLMAVTVPSLVGMMEQTRVTDSVSQIKAAIQQAQRQAVRRGRSCSITVDQVTIGGKVKTRIKITDNTNDLDCLLEQRILDESVSVTSNVGGNPIISFSPKGNKTAPNGDLIFTVSRTGNSSNQKCVLLSGQLGIVKSGIVTSGNCDVN